MSEIFILLSPIKITYSDIYERRQRLMMYPAHSSRRQRHGEKPLLGDPFQNLIKKYIKILHSAKDSIWNLRNATENTSKIKPNRQRSNPVPSATAKRIFKQVDPSAVTDCSASYPSTAAAIWWINGVCIGTKSIGYGRELPERVSRHGSWTAPALR